MADKLEQLQKMRKQDKFRGCIFGGAVGDALGFAVEFMDIGQILHKYGETGINAYELKNGYAFW